MVNKARRILIQIGKMLPFLICLILLVAYTESLVAITNCSYLSFGESTTLNTPISFWIADVFEYDWLCVTITLIISIAIETCVWNKIAITYLILHLIFKESVSDVELSELEISVLCTLNILITSFLIHKGTKRIWSLK